MVEINYAQQLFERCSKLLFMKPPKSATAAFLMFLLFVILARPAVTNAQSSPTQVVSRDFGDIAVLNSEGTNIFAFDVIRSVETEVDGNWVSGNTYNCNWTIRLDYINQGFINGSSYILFYFPTPLDNDPDYMPINTNVTVKALNNQTQLSLTQKNGTLSATFTPQNTDGYFFGFNLRFVVYINGVNSTAGLGTGSCPSFGFSTEVHSTAEELVSAPEFSSTALILVLIALVSVGVLVVKQRRLVKPTPD